MSSTPVSHPSVQRLNKAYVQVPASPLSLSSHIARSSSVHVVASSKAKENTPLRPPQFAMLQHTSTPTSLKRKLSNRDSSSHVMDAVVISTKKSRLSMDASMSLKTRQVEPSLPLSNASDTFPEGWVYCHQCNKKRDVRETVRCTVIDIYHSMKDKNPKERLCVSKYCKWCLMNRYGEDINKYRHQLPGKEGFKCPKCRDDCNCPRCRKAKGLDAIGFIAKQKPKPSKSLSKEKYKAQSISTKTKEIAKVKTQPLPQLKWLPLAINLSRDEVDERVCIREFALRFGDFLDPVLPRAHVEELEVIAGRQRRQDDDNDATSWVSEMCTRSLITNILGLLAQDSEAEVARIIKSSVKDIKACGANLNRIWMIMASLRDQIANAGSARSTTRSKGSGTDTPLTFPDPSPPSTMQARTLRSLRQSTDNLVTVVNSTQMIPVLLSLIHSALETSILREELDQGVKDAKEIGNDAKTATKLENERWEKDRSAMETATKDKAQKTENRDKRAAHKVQITNIENALKVIGPSFAPRITTLGTDTEGRIYYALSPGMVERESAVEYLELAAQERPYKPKKKARVLSLEDRTEMREWSWFVAVWGNKPPSTINGHVSPRHAQIMDNNGSASGSGDEDEGMEKWWGFWEAEEIVKLAHWVCIKAGIDDDETSSNGEAGSSTSVKEKAPVSPRISQLKRLSAGLKDYAALLQWRVRDDKATLISKALKGSHAASEDIVQPNGKGKQSIGTISPADFNQ